MATLVTIPYDVKLLIRDQLVHDFDVSFSELKSLRLVCREFNDLFLPVTYVHLQLFGYPSTADNNRQLKALSHRTTSSEAVRTLTIHFTEWLSRSSFHSIPYMRERNNWVSPILSNISKVVSNVVTIPLAPINTAKRFGAQCYRSACRINFLYTKKLRTPNVNRVRWFVWPYEPESIVVHTVKLLSRLPQLTELELSLTTVEYPKFFRHLNGLTNLRKLTFQLCPDRPCSDSQIHFLQHLIAANRNLTHLVVDIRGDHGGRYHVDLANLFRGVPVDQPLQLQHLGINQAFLGGWDPQIIEPHIRSLTSIELDFSWVFQPREFHNFWGFLASMGVYPSHIYANHIDERLFNYLYLHPNLTGLSLPGVYAHGNDIIQILSQHAKTLQYLRMSLPTLVNMVRTPRNKRTFLQCTSLQYIYCKHSIKHFLSHNTVVQPAVESFLDLVVQLDCSVHLMLEDREAFDFCQQLCRNSSNTFRRQLETRVFFTLRKGIIPEINCSFKPARLYWKGLHSQMTSDF
ncbi:hypothetical protein AMATHDRAFT_47979 [Amanita thiersii Skay4041]|uniref:F-box domain-containing protein n=1 Tax=Amanita thiersii Skay4041 TaxID=703135 RepID=A0A2A9NRE4_9AGAR|nr:hypothetical protein AMATHDRAFT_47979 [Amanita thiersii Skay4041]